MITIRVNTSREYDVLLGEGLLANAGTLIARDLEKRRRAPSRICVVTDTNVGALYGGDDQPFMQSLRSTGLEVTKYTFPGGELNKRIFTVESILDHLTEHKFTRSDLLIALGGGITGDITGFAAAIYLRGIEFIQIPTTLLAAVDSSVGGKTGVNLAAGKNLAGAFWQPDLVLFDPNVLATLTDELLTDGMAELLKAGFISDESILQEAEGPEVFSKPEKMLSLIAKAIHVKRRIVEADERESGLRQVLNLGHTVGHAIEKCSGYGISHGAAVAKGILIAARASAAIGWSQPGYAAQIKGCLDRFGYDLSCPYGAAELAGTARGDKKMRGDTITLVIPDYPGHCALRKLPADELQDFIAAGLVSDR